MTSAPITANAATVKKVGVGKTITYNAKATVKSVKSSKKGIVKATKKGKKVTIKGVKAGTTTVTVKTAKKTVKLNVKVGATKIAKKTLKTTMTAGTSQTVSVTATAGKGDTIKFASSNKAVLTVNKASAKASAKGIAKMDVKAVKEGTATLTVSSKNTGVKKAFKITVKAAAPAATNAPTVATTPGITTPTATVAATKAPSVATTPAVQTTAPTGTDTAATENPDATKDPNATVDPNATENPNASTTPGESTAPSASDDANTTPAPEVTNTPEVTTAPAVTTEPATTATPSAIEFTAKQTGDKKITITNPTAMSKDDITVKRGNTAITINNVQLSEDGTTAVITLAGSIVAVDYTVSVGEEKCVVKGEASTVADIQITSDYAPIKGELGGDNAVANNRTAVANYVVYNQFKEDITARTSLTANSSAKTITLNPNEGTMTLTWESSPRLNDVVSVVLMYQNTGVAVTKVLSVATKAAPAEVEVYGVYNADGKKLSATNVEKDNFYYLFRVKDQYGNYMNNGQISDSGANANLFVNVSSALTNVQLGSTKQTVTVDGVNYIGYDIEKKDGETAAAGEVTVMLIPGGSGKTVTKTFEVLKGGIVTSLNITVPGSVPSKGEITLNYVALDENGDDVTDYRVLKQVESSDTDFKWVKRNGKVELVYNDAHKNSNNGTSAGSAVTTVFTLPSYETKLVTVNVSDAAEAASIAGIDKDVSLATRVNAWDTSSSAVGTTNRVSIGVDKFAIEDQYGNSLDTKKVKWADFNTGGTLNNGDLAIMVVAEDENNTIFANGTGETCEYIADGAGTAKSVQLFATNTTDGDSDGEPDQLYDVIDFISNSSAVSNGENKKAQLGTEGFTFKLVQYNSSLSYIPSAGGTAATAPGWVDYKSSSNTTKANYTQTGAYTAVLTATDDSKFTSYKIDAPEMIYDVPATDTGARVSDYAKSIKVKGVLKNGQTVDLRLNDAGGNPEDFRVVQGDNLDTTDATGVLKAKSGIDYGDGDTVTGKYKVVINANGETIDKEVKICKTKPSISEIKFTGSQKGINIGQNTFNEGGANTTTNGSGALAAMLADIKAVDTYGVEYTVANSGIDDSTTKGQITLANKSDNVSQIKFTISDIDSDNGKVTNNGEKNPTFTGFVEGDSFTVTFTAGTGSFTTVVSIVENDPVVGP